MNQFKCSFVSCSLLSELECNECKMSMCRAHSEVHADEYLRHSFHELIHSKSDQTADSSSTPLPQEPSPLEFHLTTVFGIPHIFFLKSTPLTLPNDFQETLKMMCTAFIERILIMPKGRNEKIKSKCEKFSRAISNILYNFQLDIDHLHKIVLDDYTNYHSSIEGITSEALIVLLERAEESLPMPKSITKLFLYTVQLEQQKQIFCQKFFMQDKVSIPELTADFFKVFKDFIPSDHKDIGMLFNGFEEYYQKEKTRIAAEAHKDLLENISTIWLSIPYIRLGVHAYRCPNTAEYEDVMYNSIMIASLVLKEEEPKLSSVVSLSETEVLIAISLNTYSYIIYHTPNDACISLILMAENVIIASGSTLNSIIISHTCPKSIDMYAVNNNKKLEKQRNLNFYLTPMEIITDMVYIQAMDKVVFLTKTNMINSILLQGGLRVPIQIDNEDELYLRLSYCMERELLFIKSETYIKCFSEYMQYIYSIRAQGNQFTSFVNFSGQVEFLMHDNERFLKVCVDFQCTKADNDKKRKDIRFTPCTHTLAVLLPERELSHSILYVGYIQRKFMNPEIVSDEPEA